MRAPRGRTGHNASRRRLAPILIPLLGLIPVVLTVFAAQLQLGGRLGGPSSEATPDVLSVAGAQSTQAAQQQPPAAARPTESVVAAPPTVSRPTATPASAAATTSQSTSRTAAPAPELGPRTSSNAFLVYRVQPGDTVRSIAETFGVSPASVIQASGLRNADSLRVGQVLTIPNGPGYLYRVQPGETLDQIAARVGVSSDRIASASGLPSTNVGAGEVVLIPETTRTGALK